MAYINKDVSTMAMPSGMNRMGQFPLDMSSVYYDLASLQAYATSGAVAYVGQILSLVDETNNTVTLYAIKNTAGDLVQIGTDIVIPEVEIPEYSGEGAVKVDNYKISVTVDDETIKVVDGKLVAIIPEVEIPDVTATYDDVVILTAEGHALTASHAKKGPEGGAVKGATADASVSTFGGSIEFKVPHVTVDEYGHTTALDEKTVSIAIPEAPTFTDTNTTYGFEFNKETQKLTVTPSEGEAVELDLSDFLIASELPEDKNTEYHLEYSSEDKAIKLVAGADANQMSIDATPFIKDGMLSDVEYDAASNTLTFVWNTDSGLQADTVVLSDILDPYVAGDKIVIDGSKISHATIAAPELVAGGSGRTYITELVSDGFGHITGYKVATETVVDTNDNDTYSAGDGIEVSDADENDNHVVSVKIADTESRLSFDDKGGLQVDVSGIDTNDTYSGANGIEVSDDGSDAHEISIKLASDEKNLVVNENGLSTNFDLSDYATNADLSNYATNAEAKADDGIRYINQEEINKLAALDLTDGDISISGNINATQVKGLYTVVKNIVTSTGTADFDPDTEGVQAALSIEAGAQVNKIESVDSNFVITEAKQLTLAEGKHLITTAQVEKLDGIAEGAEKNFISSVDTAKFTVTDGKLELKENYVTTTVYVVEVGDLTQLIRDEGRENTTLVDEINYINERLTWGEMV